MRVCLGVLKKCWWPASQQSNRTISWAWGPGRVKALRGFSRAANAENCCSRAKKAAATPEHGGAGSLGDHTSCSLGRVSLPPGQGGGWFSPCLFFFFFNELAVDRALALSGPQLYNEDTGLDSFCGPLQSLQSRPSVLWGPDSNPLPASAEPAHTCAPSRGGFCGGAVNSAAKGRDNE